MAASTPGVTAVARPLRSELDGSLRVSWVGLVAALVVVVMFIPIRRYTLPGNLPFQMEPYRVLVATIILGWLASLLVDPRVRVLPTGFRGPLTLLVLAALGSIAVNPASVAAEQTQVVKSLSFFASFLLVLILIVSVIHTRQAVDRLVGVLVASGAVVALFSIVESRTGWNVFNELSRVLPFLQLESIPDTPGRGARLRVFGSAQHSIALSAAMVMLLPLAAYLAIRTRRHLWWAAGAVMLVAAVATLSRTGILMLLASLTVFLVIRPQHIRHVLPLALPMIILVHLVIPGAIGSLKEAFAPEGGLVAEQQVQAGGPGSGRIADLSPSLDEAASKPLLGQGFGTRVVEEGQVKAKVLDNQWLATLLETGILGVAAWLWLFGRSIRRLGAAARRDTSDRGILLAGLAASIAAFAVGMFTYDAFSFIQVTYIMFLLVALSIVLVRAGPDPVPVVPRSPNR